MRNPFAPAAQHPLEPRQEAAVVAAIRAAEAGNRGEVRVHIEQKCPGPDALARAAELFKQLGMDKTRHGTGVLLYVAQADRKAAVFAGPGIFGAAEPGFFQKVTDAVAAGAKRGALAEGLTEALGRVGDLLRERAPGEDRAGNELPDEVSTS